MYPQDIMLHLSIHILSCRFVLILNAKKAELRACQAQASTNLPSHGQRGSDGSDGNDDDDEEEGDDRSDNEGAAAASATSFYGAPPPSSSSSLSQSTRSPGKRPLNKAKASSYAESESNIAKVETSGDAYRGTDFQQGPAEGTQEVKAGDLDRLLTQDLQDQHQQPPPLSLPPQLPPSPATSVSSSSSSASQLPVLSSSSAAATRPRPPPPKRHM